MGGRCTVKPRTGAYPLVCKLCRKCGAAHTFKIEKQNPSFSVGQVYLYAVDIGQTFLRKRKHCLFVRKYSVGSERAHISYSLSESDDAGNVDRSRLI